MQELRYLTGYPQQVTTQIRKIIEEQRLSAVLFRRYPVAHEIKTDKALYDFTVELKNQSLRKANPLSKLVYDSKIDAIHHAVG